ncbi:phage tail tape measure protein [Clostridium sp. WB02_MRS01]|uniref:phage tail tape measure protein n=1 Tax=Clostridium sp. WB02_MRS01 TaxID=2605777 RepID=UPI0012B305A9|nr:phage tail tape measure protein [Clostridium sp. WB02_MRS01]MSS09509.1 phage tail tape measure protein [Clostridium sp. WB02_MRS01]
MNDFKVLLQAVLDSSGIGKSDIAEVQKVLNKYHLNLAADLNKAELIKTVKQIVPELEAEIKKITGIDIKINEADLLKAINQIEKDSIKAAKATEKLANESQRLSKINTIKAWADNNSKAMKEFGGRIDNIVTKMSTIDLPDSEFKKLNAEFEKIKISSREMGLLGKTWGDSFSDMKNKFTSWLSVSGSIMLFIQQLKDSVSELKNINTILTEISKTNDALSKSDLMNLGGGSFSVASKYGKKASDYLLGVQEASRAGYLNANGIAELSVLAQSAGDMTAELANKYLIATDAAYQLQGQTDKLNAVLDGQNEVTNRNAVNMSELAEATKVTASQAESSQIKINEMTAAVGTMIASTQQGGDVAGRAFKAILMNLQQVKGVVDEETGEIIDEDQLTKYEKAAENLGVSLKEVKDGYLALRNPMEILKELSTAYNSLQPDDSRRADLISAIGGKQRGNQLDALLKNWSKYEKMLNDYSEGSGSAFEEAMKSANNWEGSLNKLSNTITEIVDNFVEADTVIGGLNLFNGLLQSINGVTKALGDLGTIGAIGGGILGAKSLGQRNRCRYNWLRGSRSHYCYG